MDYNFSQAKAEEEALKNIMMPKKTKRLYGRMQVNCYLSYEAVAEPEKATVAVVVVHFSNMV